MQGDEVEEDRDGDRRGDGGQENVAKRIVVLEVHGRPQVGVHAILGAQAYGKLKPAARFYN
jgi:hypothetical protein